MATFGHPCGEVDDVTARWRYLADRDDQLIWCVHELLMDRNAARLVGDYATADRIRDKLRGADIEVEDAPEGTRWRVCGE